MTSLFGPEGKETRDFIAQQLAEADLGERKPAVNEKLLRIVHIVAFLTGLLAHDGQNILWVTDHDAISPTREMHQKTLELFQRVLGIYSRKNCTFPLIGGALPFEERSLRILDLLSATDIVAGCLDQYLTKRGIIPAEDIVVKDGCERVLQWLSHDGIGLKKMNVVMRPGKSGAIEAATLEFELEDPPKDATIIPVVV